MSLLKSLLLCLLLSLPASAGLLAGVARVDITPKEPVWLGGFAARTKPAQGLRQPIFAKALALKDEQGNSALLITADILGFNQTLTSSVAGKLETRFHLPRRFVLFNASHTHSAPVIGDVLAPAYPLTDADRSAIVRYNTWLESELVELGARAIGALEPAQLSFGQTLAGVAVNRRRPGNPEYPNVTDPDLPVLVVRKADGNLHAIVFGYACHNTTLDDNLISGDWAGYAQSETEAKFPGATAMFIQDCGADANPLPRHSEQLAKMYGNVIATAVAEVVTGKPVKVEGNLRAVFREVDIPFETPPSRAEWEARTGKGTDMERRHARLMVEQLDKGTLPTSHKWQAQAWKIGSNFTLLALGGEVVADYALRFKKQYGFRNLWVAGYSNDVFAYIPSLRIWKEGGYEGGGSMVAYGLPSRFQSTVEDIVVKTISEVMQSLSGQQ